jgi:hypothetical protein
MTSTPVPYRKRMRAVGAHVTHDMYDRFEQIAVAEGLRPGSLASILIEQYVEDRERAR